MLWNNDNNNKNKQTKQKTNKQTKNRQINVYGETTNYQRDSVLIMIVSKTIRVLRDTENPEIADEKMEHCQDLRDHSNELSSTGEQQVTM